MLNKWSIAVSTHTHYFAQIRSKNVDEFGNLKKFQTFVLRKTPLKLLKLFFKTFKTIVVFAHKWNNFHVVSHNKTFLQSHGGPFHKLKFFQTFIKRPKHLVLCVHNPPIFYWTIATTLGHDKKFSKKIFIWVNRSNKKFVHQVQK